MGAHTPSRRQARRDALFLLYQREVTPLDFDELVEGQRLREGYGPDDYTLAVVEGVLTHQGELDATLGTLSRDWPLDRVAPLERSALRLGLYELRHTATPPAVVIDEAVRLVKRYSTAEAASLVNGILGAALGSGDDDG